MDINESKKTYFQISPKGEASWDYDRRVMFCNECFSLGDVQRITSVYMIAPLLYQFKVYLNKDYTSDDVIVFDFDRSSSRASGRKRSKPIQQSGDTRR